MEKLLRATDHRVDL
jgi:hypothetical protein